MYGRDIVAPPGNQVATENTNLCLQHWESPVYSKIGHVRICGGDGQQWLSLPGGSDSLVIYR